MIASFVKSADLDDCLVKSHPLFLGFEVLFFLSGAINTLYLQKYDYYF